MEVSLAPQAVEAILPILAVLGAIAGSVAAGAGAAAGAVGGAIGSAAGAVGGALSSAAGAVGSAAGSVGSAIGSGLSAVGQAVAPAAQAVAPAAQGAAQAVAPAAQGAAQAVAPVASAAGQPGAYLSALHGELAQVGAPASAASNPALAAQQLGVQGFGSAGKPAGFNWRAMLQQTTGIDTGDPTTWVKKGAQMLGGGGGGQQMPMPMPSHRRPSLSPYQPPEHQMIRPGSMATRMRQGLGLRRSFGGLR
jgi:hypothetical protein